MTRRKKEFTLEMVLTTYELSGMLQVNPSSINNWARDGRLEYYTTPGGHRRISVRSALEMMWRYGMPVPTELRDARRALDNEIIANNAELCRSCADCGNKDCPSCG